ncbi:MAG: tetratricopeptide repeat protein, partial [Muribaculaceae bacterium]|nr:tetratricopeptide repeat protein [Muribaculaceae bacterium]
MADFDYAIELEPLNATALFNRGLLLAEVSANDRALNDFTKVLDLNPDDYRALYNRAVIFGKKGEYTAGTADINRVIEAFPDFPGGFYLRGEFERQSGNLLAAKRDFDKALALAKAATPNANIEGNEGSPVDNNGEGIDEMSADAVSKRFATLLTVDNNPQVEEEYNNSAIRGHVQDRNLAIDLQPLMELSYYSSPTELRPGTYYIKEVDDLNSTRMLRFVIVVTSALPNLDQDIFDRHFKSIEYYNSYLATHQPRAIDYIGRALDFITVRDYDAARRDITKALELTPDYPLAYMLNAQADYHSYELLTKGANLTADDSKLDPSARAHMRHKL